MDNYGLENEGIFKIEEVTEMPAWSAALEGRRVYFEGDQFYANDSSWMKEDSTAYYPSVAGFVAGGSAISTIDKLLFINDNVASITSKLTQAKNEIAGFNSDVAGYVAGGVTSAGVYHSLIDKLLFSNDNVASITSKLTAAKYGVAGFEN